MAKIKKANSTVIQDYRIDIRTVDRSRKDLSDWRNAITAAEHIVQPLRKRLYDLYEDLILDDSLSSAMYQRRLAVTTCEIVFQHEGKVIESISKLAESSMFEELLEHIIDSRFWGYSLIKADFTNNEAELVPRAHVIPSKNIVVQNPYDLNGIDYTKDPYTNLYLGTGKVNSLGLILTTAPLILIKRGDLSDWAQFNEIFGTPTRIGKYDPNLPGQREQMMEALKEAGAMAYLTIPVGSELEMVEANKSGAADTYKRLYERMEAGVFKVILGQTMTTLEGSSRSQAEVHERVSDKIAMSDRKFVLRVLNGKLRRILIAQGFSEAINGQFQFIEEQQLGKKDMLKMDLNIHQNVASIKKKHFAKKYNVVFVDNSDQ